MASVEHRTTRSGDRCACSLVGHCPTCDRVVCWGHHYDKSSSLAVPPETLRTMPYDDMFTTRCRDWGGNG